MLMKPYVVSKILDGCGEIEFYHPKSNSLPSSLLNELSIVIERLGSDDSVKCILLKSSGTKSFCAGASFEELTAIENQMQGKHFFLGFTKVMLAIKNASKLVITVVQGKVVGGGLGLIGVSDYVIAHESASLKLSELSLGIGPFVIAPVLKRKLGISHFMNLCLNPSQWKSSDWGLDTGLYSEVHSSLEQLNERVDQLISEYVKFSPEAIFQMKSMFWNDYKDIDEEMKKGAEKSGSLVLSDYTAEVLKKIHQK